MIYTHIAAALLAGAVAASGAWKVQEWRYGAKEAERLEEVRRDRLIAEKNIDVAASGHERDKARIRTEFITITETVEKIVREPFYLQGEQCLDDAGLRAIRGALGERAESPPPQNGQP